MDEQTINTIGTVATTYNIINYEVQTTAKTIIMVGAAVLTTAAVVAYFKGDNHNNNVNSIHNPMHI